MPTPIFLGQTAVLAHQNWLNMIGNNLANVNTFGFKSGRMRFGDIIGATIGGVTLGNGVSIAGVDTNFSQGSLQATGQTLDLALDGQGFFTLNDGNKNVFTRVGTFALDETKFLVEKTTGFRVLDMEGKDIKVNPEDFRVDGTGTTNVELVGNLSSKTNAQGSFKVSTTVFDSAGNQHTLNIELTRQDDGATPPVATNQWLGVVTSPETGAVFSDAAIDITYDSAGNPPTTPADVAIAVDFGIGSQALTLDFLGTTHSAGATNVKEGSKDGSLAITFSKLVVQPNGDVKAIKSDGSNEIITAIGVSVADNPDGLKALGNGVYEATENTGVVNIVRPREGGTGVLRAGFLETSNVDLTSELVNLIVAQRGFSTGARIITTSDQVMQETLNLKRN